MTARTLCCALAALVGGTLTAHADEKRAMPDYDGRGNPDADGGSWVLWIPRVVLSPLYVVSEYGIRRPVGAIVRRAERNHWAKTITGLFTFGEQDQNYVVPTVLVDFGLQPSAGFLVSLDDVILPDNDMRIHAATGGSDWINATFVDRYHWDDNKSRVAFRFQYLRRPDYLFLGTGPDVTDETRARYGLARLEGSAGLKHTLSGESLFTFTAGVRSIGYRAGCCSDPTLDSRIADGSLAMPVGYGTQMNRGGYTVLFQQTMLMLDSRKARPGSATGLYLRLHGGSESDFEHSNTWLTYGATAGASVDLNKFQRVLTVQAGVELVDDVQGEVPFNELSQLGSDEMAGFVRGWMNGQSTFVTHIGYRWPVWTYFDGQLRIAAGNAFDKHLDGFSVAKLRLSADVGLTSIGKPDSAFELLFGLGTETLENGPNITSARFSVGTRQGF